MKMLGRVMHTALNKNEISLEFANPPSSFQSPFIANFLTEKTAPLLIVLYTMHKGIFFSGTWLNLKIIVVTM